MNVNQNVSLNLTADGIPPRLHMVQGDSNTRTIVASLWDDSQPYNVPASAAVMMRFRKPDGTGGLYDVTESGAKISVSGNVVTVPVATQLLTVAGVVFAQVDIYGASTGAAAEKLATFRLAIEVAPSVYPDANIISSDYYNILTAKVAEAVAAADRAEQAQSAAAASAAAAATSAASAAASVEGAVKYSTPQTLTPAQQAQARENINAPAPYTAGQNISISGTTIGTKAFPCNSNLLDNWYFGNPVNQRGQTEYTSNWSYSIDRWMCAGDGNLAVGDGYCTFTGALDQGLGCNIGETLGKTLTATILLQGGVMYTGTAVDNDSAADVTFMSSPDGTGIYVNLNSSDLGGHRRFRVYCDPARNIIAVKLELGSEQTLAHQDANGNWVLNEIPDYGEQLRRCQRYCRVFPANKSMPCIAYPDPDGWYLDAALWVGDMRTAPANNLGDGITCEVEYTDGEGIYSQTMENWGLLYENMQCFRLSGTQLPSDKRKLPYVVVPQVNLVFSADL